MITIDNLFAYHDAYNKEVVQLSWEDFYYQSRGRIYQQGLDRFNEIFYGLWKKTVEIIPSNPYY